MEGISDLSKSPKMNSFAIIFCHSFQSDGCLILFCRKSTPMSSISLPVINRREAFSHLTWWSIYLILIILVNRSVNPSVSIIGIFVVTLILACGVYTIIFAGQPFVHGRSTSRLIIVAIASFLVLLGVVYVVVYRMLPAVNIFLYIEGKEFHFGKFVGFCIKNYGMAVLVALTYLITQKNRIAATRSVELERTKRMMAEEIIQLELTVLSRQLNSHWIHSIHQIIAQKVADDPGISRVYDNLQLLLVYYFEHLDKPGAMNTTLENEISYLRIMVNLNQVLHPAATPIQISTNAHPIARTIPRLLLSTLLENMFLYADQYDPAEPACMTISSTLEQLVVRCRNKINPDKRKTASTGVGHKNIRRQLDAIGRQYQFDIYEENLIYEIILTIYYE